MWWRCEPAGELCDFQKVHVTKPSNWMYCAFWVAPHSPSLEVGSRKSRGAPSPNRHLFEPKKRPTVEQCWRGAVSERVFKKDRTVHSSPCCHHLHHHIPPKSLELSSLGRRSSIGAGAVECFCCTQCLRPAVGWLDFSSQKSESIRTNLLATTFLLAKPFSNIVFSVLSPTQRNWRFCNTSCSLFWRWAGWTTTSDSVGHIRMETLRIPLCPELVPDTLAWG